MKKPMKKLLLIYNPAAGSRTFKTALDECIHSFQLGGYVTHVLKSMGPGDIGGHIAALKNVGYDAFAIAGGDGSVNQAVNAMMANGLRAPLGIIPSGTANDFASFMKLPQNPKKAVDVIAGGRTAKIDLGLVNGGAYFVNVCAAGMFSNISRSVDSSFKNTFGKLAYYIKGLEQLPNLVPFKVKISNSAGVYTESLYFFLVINSSGCGGFEGLSPGARADDGLFDFIGFRAFPPRELPLLFMKVLSGDHLNDERVLFFRDSDIVIEKLDEKDPGIATDTDGEKGPGFPLAIKNLNRVFEIFTP